MVLLLIIILILLFSGGFGYYGHRAWGPEYGIPTSLGTILLILLVLYLMGFLRR